MPTAELEGFGLTTAESLACGTPVLVTPVGANPELVRGMHEAFVATGADAGSLATAIRSLLETPELVYRARQVLKADPVQQRWSWDAVARRYAALYEQQQRPA